MAGRAIAFSPKVPYNLCMNQASVFILRVLGVIGALSPLGAVAYALTR